MRDADDAEVMKNTVFKVENIKYGIGSAILSTFYFLLQKLLSKQTLPVASLIMQLITH